MRKYEKIALIICCVLIICTAFLAKKRPHSTAPILSYKDSLKVCFERQVLRRDSLVVGYNYFLLNKFAKESGRIINFSLADNDNCIDSLYSGKYDIVVVSRSDYQLDSLSKINIDSLNLWIMHSENAHELDSLNIWYNDYCQSPSYQSDRDLYIRPFNPFTDQARNHLSPYDSLIKQYADSLNWDWRRFAAVIYHESFFHIEARSRKGAQGLMQFMPSTAALYGVEDSLEPEENIAGGYRYLKKLSNIYRKYTSSQNELFRIVLAAYNAGSGRMKDIINMANNQGISTHSWDSLKLAIPYLSDTCDTNIVKYGRFRGTETIKYVDSVEEIYDNFCRIID